jgi:F-type H+-transporting ATPase subunit b
MRSLMPWSSACSGEGRPDVVATGTLRLCPDGARPLSRPRRTRATILVTAAWLVAMAIGWPGGSVGWNLPPVAASALQPGHATGQSPPASEGGEAASSQGGESPWKTIARLFNFAILASVLVYFLRSPFVTFLRDRAAACRADLLNAAELRRKAALDIAEIDRRIAALPGEVDALRARGIGEVEAEEARIRQAAESERARLVEQARRQIDLQLRVAKQELIVHAANLAVEIATRRLQQTIREDDQLRLVERYLSQVAGRTGGAGGGVVRPAEGGKA